MSSITLINQGFSTHPSGIALNRRGRLARTFVVLSLAVVLASVFGLKAGAGTAQPTGSPASFIEITVAPGDTLWSLAKRVGGGTDLRTLVDEIASVNSLSGANVEAGQRIRIPVRS
jgi:hypothetical protein